tara:strand:+ start:148 stop:414 length:267 start_codon:yes stop_codon:yes gene_type:complete
VRQWFKIVDITGHIVYTTKKYIMDQAAHKGRKDHGELRVQKDPKVQKDLKVHMVHRGHGDHKDRRGRRVQRVHKVHRVHVARKDLVVL